ncbi:MAG: hypothetical protein HFG27_08700 [Provencibacterium sp.]|jgi:hypothetical protein|nr:hypothetical protein [Provencibacterium sp.]
MKQEQIKEKILSELDSRIGRLEQHAEDEKPAGNPYSELNHALSHAIGESLQEELRDVRQFVERL